jgi:hypothetical protein
LFTPISQAYADADKVIFCHFFNSAKMALLETTVGVTLYKFGIKSGTREEAHR